MTPQQVSELQVSEVWPEAWFSGLHVWRCKRAFPKDHQDIAAILDNTSGSLGSDWVEAARRLKQPPVAWDAISAAYFAKYEDRL